MTSTHRTDEPVRSYKDAQGRTISAAAVTFAYRELGPYPNSGHGGIFQYHDEFTATAIEFLDRP